MTRHYPDLGYTSDWSCSVGNLIQPITSTTQIWVATRPQYGISISTQSSSAHVEERDQERIPKPVSTGVENVWNFWASFSDVSGSAAKYRLFSQISCKKVFYSCFKDSAFTAVKRDAKFQTRYVKGVPFFKRYDKRGTFSVKNGL